MVIARAEAFAPATVANMGVGFDILGLAVSGVGDTVIAERRPEPGAVMLAIEGDNGKIPLDADKNVATIAANALLQQIGSEEGVAITLKKGLPIGSGLGSSAASAVAAAVAVNALLGEPLSREELLPACLEGEAAVSGYHADNVAPSLLGGITLTTGTTLSDIRKLPIPANLYLVLVTPDVEVPTALARKALPSTIPLKQMVHQTGAVAQLVDAIYRSDVKAIARSMASDQVVEPARAHLMPYLTEARAAASEAGAQALVISGAGPTLCAVLDGDAHASQVAEALDNVYKSHGMACVVRQTQVAADGAIVLDSSSI
ncbi:MAG: homoserine kinase [Anaerolineaceae bacterium]|nr:homoserine kinase [Anaerolineaceae bacterium]